MYYTIKNNIKSLSWESIFCGIDKELICPDIAVEYANYSAENLLEVSAEIIELMILDIAEKDTVLSIISDFAPKTKRCLNNCLRELRYVVLLELWQEENDKRRLSSIIDQVYSDFEYPSDMDSFVSYMPAKDGYDVSSYSEEENIAQLIENFESFMQSEKEWLLSRRQNNR